MFCQSIIIQMPQPQRAFVIVVLLTIAICPNPVQNQADMQRVSGNVAPNPNNAKPPEVVNCEAKCGSNSFCFNYCMNGQGLSTIIIVFSSLIGTLLLCIFISVLHARNKFLHFPCHKFYEIKAELNVIDPGDLPLSSFRQISAKIVENIQISHQNGNYFYIENDKIFKIQATVQVVRNEDFFIELHIRGKDKGLDWKSYGYILAKNKGEIYFWMYKLYKKKTKAGQLGENKHIVEQSVKVDKSGRIQGERVYWEYKRGERKWKLQSAQFKQPSVAQQITIELTSNQKDTNHNLMRETDKNLTTAMSQ